MSEIVDTDEAWSFFESLEDSYFRSPVSAGIPLTYESALEDLLIKVKENRIITEQCDRAVKEKLWSSQKREVTAMPTASAAVRAKNKLAERVGEGKNYAAIIPVEKSWVGNLNGSLFANGAGRCTTRTEGSDMGFPSSAADYMNVKRSLGHELIRVPSATCFLRAGTLSRRVGIKKRALLILDTSATLVDGSIVMCHLDERCACCGCGFILVRGRKSWTDQKSPNR